MKSQAKQKKKQQSESKKRKLQETEKLEAALFEAIRCKNPKLVEQFLEGGCDANTKDEVPRRYLRYTDCRAGAQYASPLRCSVGGRQDRGGAHRWRR